MRCTQGGGLRTAGGSAFQPQILFFSFFLGIKPQHRAFIIICCECTDQLLCATKMFGGWGSKSENTVGDKVMRYQFMKCNYPLVVEFNILLFLL